GQQQVAAAEVALLLDDAVPGLRGLVGVVEAELQPPRAPDPAVAGEAGQRAAPGAIAVLVRVDGQPREDARGQGHRADLASDRRARQGIPGSGAELDVLVGETLPAQRERVLL